MIFSRAHKAATYAMALSAALGALASEEVGWLSRGLALAGIATSWWAEPPHYRAPRWSLAWNIATLVFVAYLVFGVTQGAGVLSSGFEFLLFILVNKLFNRRSSRDYLQVCVVSFLLLVAATTLNTGLSYALAFVLFVVFSTWALTFLHLRREIEDNYLLRHQGADGSAPVDFDRILNSRRIIGGRFLLGTSLLALAVVFGAVATFALFPRIGFGLFAAQRRHGVLMTGFSDSVQLGQHGRIRDNPKVVMRVVVGPPGKPRETHPGAIRWRGSVFDHYSAGSWSHGPGLLGRSMPVYAVDDIYWMNYAPGLDERRTSKTLARLLRQEIYLEPMAAKVLFAADRPVALEVPRRKFGNRPMFSPRRGPLGELRTSKSRSSGVRYVAYSQRQSPTPSLLRQAKPVEDNVWQRFLQWPENLSPKVSALAKRITAQAPTIYDKAMAVQSYLRRNYRYTLTLEAADGNRDPIETFLFETRRGHCEYFASAMALLLRAVGIHTRHVNGFAGGQWNGYGGFVAVRQGDAHAWTEVLFSNLGWVTFDPTPPGRGTPPTAGPLSKAIAQLVDALRLRWFRYVIEYDLGKQIALVRRIGKAFKRATQGKSVAAKAKKASGRSAARSWIWGAAFAAILLMAWALGRRRRLHRALGRERPLHPASTLYQQALDLLAVHGNPKRASDTPADFARVLAQSGHRAHPLVRELTDCYYRCRFSGANTSSQDLARLTALVKALKQTLPHPIEGSG